MACASLSRLTTSHHLDHFPTRKRARTDTCSVSHGRSSSGHYCSPCGQRQISRGERAWVMSYAANLSSNTARRALVHSSRRLALVSAFVACSAPRGLGFIPEARHSTGSAQQVLRRRWWSAAAPTTLSRQDDASSSSSNRRRRRKRERVSMAGAGEGPGGSGADGRQGPGKGTQVVLLRHGMSTFNKLNIFTVRTSAKDDY